MSTHPTRRPRYAKGYMIQPAQRDAIMIPVHMAQVAMEMGQGTYDHFNTLIAFVNLMQEMALRMRTDDYTKRVMDNGHQVMVAVGRRFMKADKFGLSGPEMLTLRETVTLGDNLIKRANSAILMAVMAAVDEHLRRAA